MKKLLRMAVCILGVAQLQFAQQPASAQVTTGDYDANAIVAPGPADSQNVSGVNEGPLSRWLDIEALSASLRYRSTENSGGFHTFEFGQHRELFAGAVKLDEEGKYEVKFHASSGRYFNWAYSDMLNGQFTDGIPKAGAYRPVSVSRLIGQALHADPTSPYPVGIESRGAYFYFRQLYLSATPMKQVTFEYGGLGIEHGENTEITSFDDDGYISGGRIRIHDAEHLFFDEISGTWADMDGALTPNFFARGSDLTRMNYQQYMLKKKFGRFVATTDFTQLRTTKTAREAFKVKVPEVRFIDTARLELYQRANEVSLCGLKYPSGSGFAVSGAKTFLRKNVTLEGGYAHVDHYYGVYTGDPFLIAVGFSWNSDSFMTGSKAYTRSSVKIAPGVSFFGFFAHEVSPYQFFITNHATVNGGVTFDMKEWLHKGHIL